MKHIRPHEIIHSKEFLREPVQDTFKEIESISTSKIILRGEGTGRSILLNYMQEKKSNTKQPFILLNFNNVGFDIEKNEIFPKEFFEHYWEINFTRKILLYIKEKYEMTYHSEFSSYSDVIRECNQQIDNVLNSILYLSIYCLPKYYTSKEISGEVLDKLKKIMHIESVELGIDSFDSINNSNELTQKILSSYFDLFDKTIIAVNDESLPLEWYKIYFKEDSDLYTFQPFSIEYGKNLEIIYNIIVKRIKEYNNSLDEENLDLDWLDYNTLNLLINYTNGNIRLILDIVNKLTQLWKLNGSITQKNIEETIYDKLVDERKRKLMLTYPKLHL